MRTASKNPVAKQKLLDVSEELVLKKGFSGTTLDDICKAAKLTKGSFFHYFKSKDELGKELLSRYCVNSKAMFLSGCCQKEMDPLKRIYGFLDFMIEMSREKNSKGCLLASMSQELADTDRDIRSICARAFTEMGEMLKKDLTEAKAKYKPKAVVDPKSLADHFVAIMEGATLVSKVRGDRSVKVNSFTHFKEYLKALFGR